MSKPTTSERRWLLAILAVGAALRLAGLARHSLWLDEMTSILVARAPLSEILGGRVFDNHTPPLYYVLLHFWGRAFGWSESMLRLLSAGIDIVNLALIPILLRRFVPTRSALLATAAYAISPFALYYAHEGRMYTMTVLIALLFALALERTVRASSGAPLYALAAALLLAAGVYTHYFFAFFAIGPFTLALWAARRERGRLVALLSAGMLSIALFVPWLPMVMTLATSGGQGFREFGLATVPYTLFRFAIGYAVFPINMAEKADFWWAIRANLPTLSAVFGMLTLAAWAIVRGPRPTSRVLATGWLFACPMLAGLLVTLAVPMLSERYMSVSHPFFLAFLLGALDRGPLLSRVARGALLAALALGTVAYFANPRFGKTEWRAAATWVEAETDDGSPVLVQPGYAADVFGYYYPASDERPLVAANMHWLDDDGAERYLRELTVEHARIVVVSTGPFADRAYDEIIDRYATRTATRTFDKETGVVCTIWESDPETGS